MRPPAGRDELAVRQAAPSRDEDFGTASFGVTFRTRWRELSSACPVARSFILPRRVPALMAPCVWGSECSPGWTPGEKTQPHLKCGGCGELYHQACANGGVHKLLGQDFEEEACGTCGEFAAAVKKRGLAFPPARPTREEGVCDAPACPRKPDDGTFLQPCALCQQLVLCGVCQTSFYRDVPVLGELNAQHVESQLPPVCGFCFKHYCDSKPEFFEKHTAALEATNAAGLDAFQQAVQRDSSLLAVPPAPPPLPTPPADAPPPSAAHDTAELRASAAFQSPPAALQCPDVNTADPAGGGAHAALPPGNMLAAVAHPPLVVPQALVFVPARQSLAVVVGVNDGKARLVLFPMLDSLSPNATPDMPHADLAVEEVELLTHRPMDTVRRGRASTGSNGSTGSGRAGNQLFGHPNVSAFGVNGFPFGFWRPGMDRPMRLGDCLSLGGGATIAKVDGDAQLFFSGAVRCTNQAWSLLALTFIGDVPTLIAIPPGDLRHASSGDHMPEAKLMPLLQRVRLLRLRVATRPPHELTPVAAVQLNAAGLKVHHTVLQRRYGSQLFAWQVVADGLGVDSVQPVDGLVLNGGEPMQVPEPRTRGGDGQEQRPKRLRQAAPPPPESTPSSSPTRSAPPPTRGGRGGGRNTTRGGARGAGAGGRGGRSVAALAARGGPGARASGGAAGRGGAAARGGRGQEVMSVDDTSSDSDPAELSSPRKQRRRVETGAAARGASGHGPGLAAAVAEQQAPAAANAQGDAVANNPPAPPPTQPPGPPAAPAPAFDPLHPSRAAVVGAVSHYLGIVYNSDAVKNDATGQVATLSLAFIERLIHGAPPPPPPR